MQQLKRVVYTDGNVERDHGDAIARSGLFALSTHIHRDSNAHRPPTHVYPVMLCIALDCAAQDGEDHIIHGCFASLPDAADILHRYIAPIERDRSAAQSVKRELLNR